jgi:serralysin
VSILEKDQFDLRILQLINLERAKVVGLKPLQLSQKLDAAADSHSERMAAGDFFDHVDPLDKSMPWDRARRAGYAWTSCRENVAAGYTTAESVVAAWMKSPGHRANILSADITHMGVGYAYLAKDTGLKNYNHYWTQLFGAGDRSPGIYVAEDSGTLYGTSGTDSLVGGVAGDLLFGLEGNDVLRGQDGGDKVSGDFGNDSLYGGLRNDTLTGGDGSDWLRGDDHSDRLIGVNPDSGRTLMGVGERDQLFGGTGADVFELGDRRSVFYDDGVAMQNGRLDYGFIRDFKATEGDKIQLHGSAADYVLGTSVTATGTNTIIYLKERHLNEIIGVVSNVTLTSLTSSNFTYSL